MIPENKTDKYRKVVGERTLLRQHFPFLHCRISGLELICRGRIQPTEPSPSYRVEISYSPWSPPRVRVVNPMIQFTPGAHMYHDDTLCLFDWREHPWQKNWHLHQTIVPWTAEWLVFYELFLLTGKWHGKSAVHDQPKPADLAPSEINNEGRFGELAACV